MRKKDTNARHHLLVPEEDSFVTIVIFISGLDSYPPAFLESVLLLSSSCKTRDLGEREPFEVPFPSSIIHHQIAIVDYKTINSCTISGQIITQNCGATNTEFSSSRVHRSSLISDSKVWSTRSSSFIICVASSPFILIHSICLMNAIY